MATAVNTQRILGQQVTLTWSDSDGSQTPPSMFQIDSFQWRFNPDIVRYWPSGAKTQARQAVNTFFEVTMTGGQVDIGFADVVAQHFSDVAGNKKPPTISLTRTVKTTDGNTFSQDFSSGIITAAGGDQADGNRPLTQTITIEFSQMTNGGTGTSATGNDTKASG
jgi:hypothetical protein